MPGSDTVKSLLVRRKLTRAIADAVRAQLTEHLSILTPLLWPQTVFGDHVQGTQREPSHKADQAFKELQALYDAVAPVKPFNLRRELTPPLTFVNPSLELTPLDYTYAAVTPAGAKQITIRSPLTWTLTYEGFSPARLQEALDQKVRGDELQRFILSYLLIHLVTTHRPGVMTILKGLHFPFGTHLVPEFGDLPMTRIEFEISTERPSDAVVLESAELTGMDAFEEVVNADDVSMLRDSMKERLTELARQHIPQPA
jgi:hypothetical protein